MQSLPRYDEGIDVRELDADFVIVKATEGLQGTIYNRGYRSMADAALSSGKLLGFYHYANGDDPVDEADSFYDAICDYRGRAVPCLDWERRGNRLFGSGEDPSWCRRFMERMEERMGATPMLYISKGVANEHDWSECSRWPLWGAEYPNYYNIYGYQDDPWQSGAPWGVWGERPKLFQYTSTLVLERNGGIAAFDGDLFYGDRSDWERMCRGGNTMSKLTYALAAAEVCDHFIDHDAHGYSQPNRDGAGYEEITLSDGTEVGFSAADRDCSRLMQTCYVVVGALPRGMHMWTGNEREVLLDNGFVEVSLDDVERGDVLWRAGHTEMYLGDWTEGGARQSEYGTIDGEPGDQTGEEIARSEYQPWHWESAYRCVSVRPGSEDEPEPEPVIPEQPDSEPYNDLGLHYRAHVQNAGWLPAVHDGQIAGSEGYSARLEAIKITPPEGVVLDVHFHIQGYGWLAYDNVLKGVNSGTESSENDPIMGTTGESRRAEAVKVHVIQWPDHLAGKHIHLQAHCQGIGWMDVVGEGEVCGTTGQSRRLEAVRMWID